ncbi:hypothetical protein NP493_338g02014 [Ridgeia piscesae]|uniref:Uncharacterized protein n=1 Tax=Ridgeia piscesae TaxID=27915 RepID=A0AAD9NVM4_RIDPI|nr:hypothetical protein NP493_338g02014 [Ridgeia piscesae]
MYHYDEVPMSQTMHMLPHTFWCINSAIQEMSIIAIFLWLVHWVYAETFGKPQPAETPTVDVVDMNMDTDDDKMSVKRRGRNVRMHTPAKRASSSTRRVSSATKRMATSASRRR